MTTDNVYKNVGDALEAERIAARTKKIGRMHLETGSGAHRIQALSLTDYAYCVIERPLRGVVAGRIKKVSKK